MVGSTEGALLRAVHAAQRRGELGGVAPLRYVEPGVWTVRVVRLRPPAPRWRRPVLVVSAIVAGLAILAGAGWLLFAAISAAVAGISVAAVLTGVALLWLALAGMGSSGGSCTVTHTRR